MRACQTFAVLALVVSASAPAMSQVVKVGVVNTFSGPQAVVGEYIDHAMRLYLKQHLSELPPGVTIEILNRDDGGANPDKAKQLARELVVRDKVHLLVGGSFTPNALAIAPIAEESKTPFFITNAGTSNIPSKSNYIARFSFTFAQSAVPLGDWAAKRFKSTYVMVSDYASGYDVEKAFSEAYKRGGGSIAGGVRVPLHNQDFAAYMQRAKDAKPDAVMVFTPGGKTATAVMKSFIDLGLKESGIKLIGPGNIVPDEELANMGEEALGVTTVQHYSAAATRPANLAFVQAWRIEYGERSTPNYLAVAGYDAMAAIFHAIKQQNGKMSGDVTMALMKGYANPVSPRGPISIDPTTRDIIQGAYLREIRRVNGQLANVEVDTIAMAVKDVHD